VEEQRPQTHDTGRDTEQAQQIALGENSRGGTAGTVGDQADPEQRDGDGEGVHGDELGERQLDFVEQLQYPGGTQTKLTCVDEPIRFPGWCVRRFHKSRKEDMHLHVLFLAQKEFDAGP
jgi:hypothetical protein